MSSNRQTEGNKQQKSSKYRNASKFSNYGESVIPKHIYILKNILPPSILLLNHNKRKISNKCSILDDGNKINYEKYKYDLNSLFTNTPHFDEPNLTFKMKGQEYDSKWGKVADMVLNSKEGKIKRFMSC